MPGIPTHSRGFDIEAARAHLARRDRKFARWLDRIAPIAADPRWQEPFDPVDALARAILYQQLSGRAAGTIVARVEQGIGSERLHAGTLDRLDDDALRACGVSRNKILALRDLCARELRGEVPGVDDMLGLRDEEIVNALVPIRGIGLWTVQMMLIFRLGRPDVLPVDDLGVRRGAQQIDHLDDLPKPRELAERGERWGPFRSYAALALWRISDLAAVAPVKRSQE